MHLKPTAGWQISTLTFGFGGNPIHIPWKITEGLQSSLPLGIYFEGISRAFNWFQCLGRIMHLKPTAGCQISILMFENKLLRGSLKISHTNISRTAKFLPTFIYVKSITRVFNWLKYLGRINAPQVHSRVSNINFDIWKKIVEGVVSMNIP